MVMHYRPSTNEVINIIEGSFVHQHDVDLLSGGRISIFDNNARLSYLNILLKRWVKNVALGTKKFSSYLDNALANDNVQTAIHGRSQILPNGDLYMEQTQSE